MRYYLSSYLWAWKHGLETANTHDITNIDVVVAKARRLMKSHTSPDALCPPNNKEEKLRLWKIKVLSAENKKAISE